MLREVMGFRGMMPVEALNRAFDIFICALEQLRFDGTLERVHERDR